MPISTFKIKAGRTAISGLLLLGMACLSFGSAYAAGTQEEARMQFEKDKTFCREDPSVTDRRACIREAGATFEKKRARQNGKSASINRNFEENALRRCQTHSGEARRLCEERVMSGPVRGSVKGGGVMYEAIVKEVPVRNP